MDLIDELIDFNKTNRAHLMSYDDVILKMKKFSFTSRFYKCSDLLPKYMDESNFLFGFEFGVIILKDKLLWLGKKLWIHLDFTFLEKIIICDSSIKRENDEIRVGDSTQLELFISLMNILLNKTIEIPDKKIIIDYQNPYLDYSIFGLNNLHKNTIIEIIKNINNNNNTKSIELLNEVFNNKLEENILIIDKIRNLIPILEVQYKEILVQEIHRVNKLSQNQDLKILELDKDGDGQVDLIDGESFNKLLNKHQKAITEIDKNYIQKFVKISLYLKTKKKNTQLIFDSIRETRNEKELEELISLLKNQIHTYEILVFHSICMITSLIESDLITFYEIYESFDQLGVFNSNWENEVSNKLIDIGDGIKDLMYSIDRMEYNITSSLDSLTYTTQESFSELNHSITSQLNSIDSSINFNNLLTGIQTYQLYKINQNTKSIE